MPSPFPGMDPYLEDPGLWPDVHNTLIVTVRELLTQRLRPKYYVRIEERVYITDDNNPGRPVRIPDLRIANRPEHAHLELPWSPEAAVGVAEPETFVTLTEAEVHEPYLNVVDRERQQVVAVIEVLSPTNKVPGSDGQRSYQQKRAEVLDSPSHWVEIDLLRTGVPTVPRAARPYDYLVQVSRVGVRPRGTFWRILLPQRLPAITVPLQAGDPDAVLDLQQALNLTYDRAGYDGIVKYQRLPEVVLTAEQAAWADDILRSKGLR